jgi:hypothetical protein
MQLDLVDGRHHLGPGDELLQVLGAEIADADRPDPTLRQKPFSRPYEATVDSKYLGEG